MQDLKALEGKSLAELHEIAKALGIEDVMVKKRELIERSPEVPHRRPRQRIKASEDERKKRPRRKLRP